MTPQELEDQKRKAAMVPVQPGIPGYADGGEIPTPDAAPGNWDQIKNWVVGQGAPQAPVMPPAAPTVDQQATSVLGDPAQLKAERDAAIQPGVGGIIGMGLAGLGDSLARSYGHDQTSNHMGDVQKLLQDRAQNVIANQKIGVEQGKERFGVTQGLSKQDPKSMLSRQAQSAALPTFQKLGFKPEDVANMPADMIDNLMKNNVEYQKAKADQELKAQIADQTAQFHKDSLAQQGNALKSEDAARKNNAEHQRTDDTEKAQEDKRKALEEVAKHYLAHPLDARAAQKQLADMALAKDAPPSHGVPDLGSTFNGGKVLSVKRVK